MNNLELPAQMTPCVRIFIVALLDGLTAGVTNQVQRLPSALVIAGENDSARDEGESRVQILNGAS